MLVLFLRKLWFVTAGNHLGVCGAQGRRCTQAARSAAPSSGPPPRPASLAAAMAGGLAPVCWTLGTRKARWPGDS